VLNQFRTRIRSLGRPLVSCLRRIFTPPQPQPELKSVEINHGILSGCRLLLPSPSALAEKIILGSYEAECSLIVQLLLKRRDVCYDIGGHCGFYSHLFSKLAFEGQVHCFEPVPELAERIRRSASSNGFSNVTVHAMAVADRQQELTLRIAANQFLDDSMGYLSDFGGVDTERSRSQYGAFSEIRVPCQSLDQMELPDPCFIKVDAEAAEASILRGAQKMLQRCRPRLLIEIHGPDLALQCAHLLGPIGYTAIKIMNRCENMSILWLHREDSEAWKHIGDLMEGTVPILYSPFVPSGV
jgi:FkbM family methyltransferase